MTLINDDFLLSGHENIEIIMLDVDSDSSLFFCYDNYSKTLFSWLIMSSVIIMNTIFFYARIIWNISRFYKKYTRCFCLNITILLDICKIIQIILFGIKDINYLLLLLLIYQRINSIYQQKDFLIIKHAWKFIVLTILFTSSNRSFLLRKKLKIELFSLY